MSVPSKDGVLCISQAQAGEASETWDSFWEGESASFLLSLR